MNKLLTWVAHYEVDKKQWKIILYFLYGQIAPSNIIENINPI